METQTKPYIIEPQEAQKDIENTLHNIVNIVIESELSLYFIGLFLGGGFGRGEGSVIKYNGKYQTTNDFDLFALTKEQIIDRQKRKLEEEIETRLNLKDCSIDIIYLDSLLNHCDSKHLSQSLFDFLKGNILLWKNPKNAKYLNLFDRITNEKYFVKKYSAYDVLRTRLWCIIAPLSFKNDKIIPDIEYKPIEFVYFQIIKAATAIVDAVLIIDNEYESPRFVDKLKKFKCSVFYKENDAALVCQLIEGKIRNNSKELVIDITNIEQVIKLYINAVQYVIYRDIVLYKKYVIYDWIRYVYVKYIKRIDSTKNYSLKSVYLLSDHSINIKKIKRLQAIMRKNN